MWRFGLWFLLCAVLAEAQVITTIAGTDPVFPVTGVPALAAPLRSQARVAVDAGGNVYIADKANNVVARVSPNGILTVVTGNGRAGFSGDGGAAINASLNGPLGLAIDAADNLLHRGPAKPPHPQSVWRGDHNCGRQRNGGLLRRRRTRHQRIAQPAIGRSAGCRRQPLHC
jgi:hypothetical protein